MMTQRYHSKDSVAASVTSTSSSLQSVTSVPVLMLDVVISFALHRVIQACVALSASSKPGKQQTNPGKVDTGSVRRVSNLSKSRSLDQLLQKHWGKKHSVSSNN